jgi:hypothetical protein
MGNVTIFDTDRSLSGQDGETYTSASEASDFETFPARLAHALFDHDPALSSVYVYSNTVSVARRSEWTDAAVAEFTEVIRNFLVHYEENRATA